MTTVTGGVGPWCLVVPVKLFAQAKTRLTGFRAGERAELARAFALDTVRATLSCPSVAAVVVVTDEAVAGRMFRRLGARVVPDVPARGLNAALSYGAVAASIAVPGCRLGALAADLPAARPHELSEVLAEARRHDASFVRDAGGSGTTLLLTGTLHDFAPRFGDASAQAHARAGAVELTGDSWPGLRRDVDTAEDLAGAVRIGLPPQSSAVVSRLHPRL